MSNAQPKTADPRNERSIACEIGLKMADQFRLQHGRLFPADDVEFAGMLAIAFLLGRESATGRITP